MYISLSQALEEEEKEQKPALRKQVAIEEQPTNTTTNLQSKATNETPPLIPWQMELKKIIEGTDPASLKAILLSVAADPRRASNLSELYGTNRSTLDSIVLHIELP